MEYPLIKSTKTFGAAIFWVEEYWAFIKLESLRKKTPDLDLSGFINSSFQKKIPRLLKEFPHTKLQSTRNYNDLEIMAPPTWDDQRRFINLSSSHAPSRLIAKKYLSEFGNKFAIISIDAHFDMSSSLGVIHSNWLTEELSERTAVVGGWAEASSDRKRAQHNLKFVSSSLTTLLDDLEFKRWLSGKKIYVTIDLDYFTYGQSPFLGYANYWHRDKIIGHTMNIDQLFEAKIEDNHNLIWLGTLFDYHNLGDFIARKKKSIRTVSSELSQMLTQLVNVFENTPRVSLLALDFVEYSPICDWNNMTLNELIGHYPKMWSLFHSFRAEEDHQ
jgi:arginase family enzyme